MVWAAGFKFIDTHLLETVGLENLCYLGRDCTGDDCLWRNVNERCAEAGSETSNGVVEKDYTAESMRKPQYWMLAVMFPDCVHEWSVCDWCSERYRSKSGAS